MELVHAHDAQWGTLRNTGIAWELLSPAIDNEEPEAAVIISVFLMLEIPLMFITILHALKSQVHMLKLL